jgi:hypothetical protein
MRYLRQTLFADWGIYTPWAIYLTTVCPSSLISIIDTNNQLASWAYITANNPNQIVIPHPAGTTNNCNHLLDYVLESKGRVEPSEGLGDLLAASAGLLDSEHAGGGVMQREMGALLWGLVHPIAKSEGKKRRFSP